MNASCRPSLTKKVDIHYYSYVWRQFRYTSFSDIQNPTVSIYEMLQTNIPSSPIWKGGLWTSGRLDTVWVLQEATPGIIIKTSITGKQLVGVPYIKGGMNAYQLRKSWTQPNPSTRCDLHWSESNRQILGMAWYQLDIGCQLRWDDGYIWQREATHCRSRRKILVTYISATVVSVIRDTKKTPRRSSRFHTAHTRRVKIARNSHH